ncbi:MAG: alpha-L-fucosidase [Chlorobi bacterium]|nr:alpha-L-fucosidase [Chlorobiota bacterium]
MKNIKLSLILFLLVPVLTANAQETDRKKAKRMEWFKDAKLGIFIHYGIYSVYGIDESWSFYNEYLSYEDYMKQLDGFTASDYDAGKWIKLFKEAGARYAVLTTKHHDGVALWDTKQDHLSVVKDSPAGKDIVKPFVKALRENDMKVGLYFSLIDWSYPDYPGFTRTKQKYKNDPERWDKFVKFYFGQMKELSYWYDPDLYWFDGDWEHSAEEWKAKELHDMLFEHNPKVILNSRLRGYGDYSTPEQGAPITKPANPYWELCMTINDSWGYQRNDHNYKSPYQMLRIFADCIAMGGNLLMDVGPKEDGTIPAEQINVLKEFGRWTKKYSEAIYGTRAGLPQENYYGASALSKDKKTLYLYVNRKPNSTINVLGLKTEVKNARLAGTNKALDFEQNNQVLKITLPEDVLDPAITVIALDLKKTVEVTRPDISFFDLEVKPLYDNARWNKKHSVAINDFNKGIEHGHYTGPTALSKNKDILYLFLDGKPNGPLVIKGLKNKINRIWVVGKGNKLNSKVIGKQYWSSVPGITYIDVPDFVLDPATTVIAVLLDGPVKLYREKGQVIESN